MVDCSYAKSIEIYLERCRGDVWTLEMKDRGQKDLELFAPFKNDLKKKIAIGAVSHRMLQADRPEDVAGANSRSGSDHRGGKLTRAHARARCRRRRHRWR